MIDPYFSIGLALFASVAWGLNSHVLKFGLVKQDPIQAIVIRSIFAIPPLLLIVLIWKGMDGLVIYFQSDTLPYVVISSILVLFGDAMFITGLQRNKVNVILPISSIYPLFTTIILIITGTESVGIITVIGTLIIIFGIMLVTSNGSLTSFSKDAFIFGVSAAFGWGTSVFFIKKILDVDGTDGLGLLGIRNCILGLEALTLYYFLKQRHAHPDKQEPRTK
ncbi:MAG: EamA family transporter, partial [Candidatus Kariarchaeaceae archaeon]